MRGFLFDIEGNWAHFKKPETNNNPLTHEFITKSALVGLIGAVLGIEREKMRPMFPQLSEDLLYGIQIQNPIKKESWGFTLRKAVNLFDKAPKQMELLKWPRFRVALVLSGVRSEAIFSNFIEFIKKGKACFTPVLGLHNCPANLSFNQECSFSDIKIGVFRTNGFFSKNHRLKDIDEFQGFRVGMDRIPTFQDDDFWNPPDKYVDVIYPTDGNSLKVEGEFYECSNGGQWWLI